MQAEAERGVKIGRRLDVGRGDLDMVEALRAAAMEFVEALHQPRQRFHRDAEFDRRARAVMKAKRAALVRQVEPAVLDVVAVEISLGGVEVAIGQHPETDGLTDRRGGGSAQHQAVVAGFFEPAQIGGIIVAVRQHQTEHVAIEGAARVEIAARQHHVADARDVEGGIQHDRR